MMLSFTSTIAGASLAFALGLSACVQTDPGSGSKTLYALCEIEGRANETQLSVSLKSEGNTVIGANVVAVDRTTERTINLEGGERSAGYLYDGIFSGYAQTIQIKITSGDDTLEAQLVGPISHEITRPPNDAIVRRGSSDKLSVRWNADDSADKVVIRVDQENPQTLQEDDFAAEYPISNLQDGAHSIEIERENTVDLAGGTSGSLMRIRYKVDNRFTIEG
jgi:hypothetical protein